MLFRTLVEVNLFPSNEQMALLVVPRSMPTYFMLPPSWSITVPCLRRPFGPMMIGSTI